MPDLQAFTDSIINMSFQLWAFLVSGWFVSSILVVKFILPKLFKLFGLSIGR